MKESFPGMFVELRYRVTVISGKQTSGTTVSASYPSESQDASLSATIESEGRVARAKEVVSCHDLARKIFVEAYCLATENELYIFSTQSMRAIHIVALALRGFVRKNLGMTVSSMDDTALGDYVVLEVDEASSDKFGAMIDRTHRRDSKSASYVSLARSKFEVNLSNTERMKLISFSYPNGDFCGDQDAGSGMIHTQESDGGNVQAFDDEDDDDLM